MRLLESVEVNFISSLTHCSNIIQCDLLFDSINGSFIDVTLIPITIKDFSCILQHTSIDTIEKTILMNVSDIDIKEGFFHLEVTI